MKKLLACIVVLGCLCLSSNSFAAYAEVGPVSLTYVFINSSHFSHKPGNMEVGITGGSISGLSCSPTLITTLESAGGFKTMFELLTQALVNNRQVTLGVTENGDVNAFPGRCSLRYVLMH